MGSVTVLTWDEEIYTSTTPMSGYWYDEDGIIVDWGNGKAAFDDVKGRNCALRVRWHREQQQLEQAE